MQKNSLVFYVVLSIAVVASAFSVAVILGALPTAVSKEGGYAAEYWTSYEKDFTADCMSGDDPIFKEVMPEICACSLKKIETNHSISEIQADSVPGSTYDQYGMQCAYEAFDEPGPYTPGVRSALVEGCLAKPGIGDEGPAYCNCLADKLEAEFTFAEVMQDLLSEADTDRISAFCLSEVTEE